MQPKFSIISSLNQALHGCRFSINSPLILTEIHLFNIVNLVILYWNMHWNSLTFPHWILIIKITICSPKYHPNSTKNSTVNTPYVAIEIHIFIIEISATLKFSYIPSLDSHHKNYLMQPTISPEFHWKFSRQYTLCSRQNSSFYHWKFSHILYWNAH